MIVHHRQQDAGTATEYTMAMDRTEFIAIHELVRETVAELEPIKNDEKFGPFYALLRMIDMAMTMAVGP